MEPCKLGQVLDIGGSSIGQDLVSNLKTDFLRIQPGGARTIPTELFYHGAGLELWNKVCWIPGYHQTRDEISLLENYGDAICKNIPPGCILVDMGSGDIRKSACLLERLDSLNIPVSYYALDLSRETLAKSMAYLAGKYNHVQFYGLWGTFEDGRQWLRSKTERKCVLSLGSMFGNDEFELAVARMLPWREVLEPNDIMLLGMDARGGQEELTRMYHDNEGIWEAFIRTGFEQSNQLLGATWFQNEDWMLDGIIRNDPPFHKFALRAVKDVECQALGLHIKQGETVEFFESWKHGPDTMALQFEKAGMVERGRWRSPRGAFCEFTPVTRYSPLLEVRLMTVP